MATTFSHPIESLDAAHYLVRDLTGIRVESDAGGFACISSRCEEFEILQRSKPHFFVEVVKCLKSSKMFALVVRRASQMFAQLVPFAPGMFAWEGAILRDKYREISRIKQIKTVKS